jgi:glycine/D-amino acid oxidase-like deaminating enzyme
MSDATPDVIVVGAGLAGLVSTLELLRSGHSVLLLDRCRPEQLGGLAREAFGGMFMVDSPEQRRSRIPDNERLALEDWLRIADFDAEDVWPRRWAERDRREVLPGRQLGRARQLRRRQLGAALSPHLGHRQGSGAGRLGCDRDPPAPWRARVAPALACYEPDLRGRSHRRLSRERRTGRRNGRPRKRRQTLLCRRGLWRSGRLRGASNEGGRDCRRWYRWQPRSDPPRMADLATGVGA